MKWTWKGLVEDKPQSSFIRPQYRCPCSTSGRPLKLRCPARSKGVATLVSIGCVVEKVWAASRSGQSCWSKGA
eukprot:4449000-Pleurochrysis_carterae.AAC.1